MTHTPTGRFPTARLVVGAARDQQVTFLAAGVAYYAFVSLLPTLLLLVVVAGSLFGDVVATRALAVAGGVLTPTSQEAVGSAVTAARGRAGAGLLGLGVLLWSTLKLFRGLDTAFAEVYGTEETAGVLRQLADAASVVFAVGVGIAAMLAVGVLVAAAGFSGRASVSVLALPVVLGVAFLPMYYLLPQPPMTLREAAPGAVFAATGWTVSQAGFQAYATAAGQYQVYGVIGGVLLLITWLYVAAMVVILGAVLNAVVAGGSGPRPPSSAAESAGREGTDRQLQHGSGRPTDMNGEADREGESGDGDRPRGAPDVAALEEEVRGLRAQLDEFEADIEDRTVDRPKLESELKRYVRSRMRRGHARGWGPYLVLLYGTVLTLGAFTFLEGAYAIAAMVVLGLSTLGLYTLFILVGLGLNLIGTPGKALDYARRRGGD